MMFKKNFCLFLIVVSVSINAYAAEVYRTVDEDGNVVFSDIKTHDAKTINVQPNVIDLDIPDMPESGTQAKSKKRIPNNSTAAQQEMSGWNTNNGSNLRRRVRTETNGEGVNRHKATPRRSGSAGGR